VTRAVETNNSVCLAFFITMPICPKCHKSISANNYARHLKRCGTTHKHQAGTLDHPENFFMKI
jgi:hypothetical protein